MAKSLLLAKKRYAFIWRDPFWDIEECKVLPWFKSCIGTEHTFSPWYQQRKLFYIVWAQERVHTECMLVCSFDMRFTKIWPGCEGSVHDFRICTEVTTRWNTNFLHPSQGSTMSLMLATPRHGDTLLLTEFVKIICRTTEAGIGLEAIRRYWTMRSPPYRTMSRDVLRLWKFVSPSWRWWPCTCYNLKSLS